QLPATCSNHFVDTGVGAPGVGVQLQVVTGRVVQPVAALGLADVTGHQRYVGGQGYGQFKQGGGGAGAQFQFQFADRLLAAIGNDLALVQGHFHFDLFAVTLPAQDGLGALKVGGEHRLQQEFVEGGEAGGPAAVVQQGQVQRLGADRPVPFIALGQPSYALALAFERLNELLAITAYAQRDTGGSQFAASGVEVLVVQGAGLPGAGQPLGNQRVAAQCLG